MIKDNALRSSTFYMDADDVCHVLIDNETGDALTVQLWNETINQVEAGIPDPPIALESLFVDETSFVAYWRELSTDLTSLFYLDVSTDPNFGSFVTGYNQKEVSYFPLVEELTIHTTYYWRVRASGRNEVGYSDYSNVMSVYTDTPTPLPAEVTIGTQTWKTTNVDDYINKFEDYFLPSKDEVTELGTYFGAPYSMGDPIYIWSSSESAATKAWALNLDDAVWYELDKSNTSPYIFPCRSYISSDVLNIGDTGEANGIIFYVIDNGDTTYTYYELFNSAYEQTDTKPDTGAWSNISLVIGTTGTAIGDGAANTTAIIGQVGHTVSAAYYCDHYITSDEKAPNAGTREADRVKYGALYSFAQIADVETANPGYHVPTDAEWTTLTDYLGGLTAAGGALKEDGYGYWIYPNTGATNSSGFYARGGGAYIVTGGIGRYNVGYWLTATESSGTTYYSRRMQYSDGVVNRFSTATKATDYMSIRLIKD